MLRPVPVKSPLAFRSRKPELRHRRRQFSRQTRRNKELRARLRDLRPPIARARFRRETVAASFGGGEGEHRRPQNVPSAVSSHWQNTGLFDVSRNSVWTK